MTLDYRDRPTLHTGLAETEVAASNYHFRSKEQWLGPEAEAVSSACEGLIVYALGLMADEHSRVLGEEHRSMLTLPIMMALNPWEVIVCRQDFRDDPKLDHLQTVEVYRPQLDPAGMWIMTGKVLQQPSGGGTRGVNGAFTAGPEGLIIKGGGHSTAPDYEQIANMIQSSVDKPLTYGSKGTLQPAS